MNRTDHSKTEGEGHEHNLGVEATGPTPTGTTISWRFGVARGYDSSSSVGRASNPALERLSLHFGRMWWFSADATIGIRGRAALRTPSIDLKKRRFHDEELVVNDGYWFWLREPDALRMYVKDVLEIPDDVVAEALWRAIEGGDLAGRASLPEDVVTGLLTRYGNGLLALPEHTVITALRQDREGQRVLPDEMILRALRDHASHRIELPDDIVRSLLDEHNGGARVIPELDPNEVGPRNGPLDWEPRGPQRGRLEPSCRNPQSRCDSTGRPP